jgi:hypothetical protein
MTRYYAAEMPPSVGPYEPVPPLVIIGENFHRTWTAANEHLAGRLGADAHADPSRWSILLDVGSVDVCNEEELRTLLLHDPLIRAIYEYGRQDGAR